MPKQIIILERTDNNRFRVAYWVSPPVPRRPFYANPDAKSAYVLATDAELADLRSGAVVERVEDHSFPVAANISQVRAGLLQHYNSLQQNVTAANPWDRYGTYYDGTAWVPGGVT